MKVLIGDYPKGEGEREVQVELSRDDLFSLDYTLALVILPALQAFRTDSCGWPGSLEIQEEWEAILDKMIAAFTRLASDEFVFEKEARDQIQEGLDLFAQYYQNLWQ